MRALLAAATLALAACSHDETAPKVRALDEPRALQPFALVDHQGQRFDEKRLAGRWTFLTFGFTSCPDACPTMLANVAELRRSLLAGWKGVEPQFVFVTVDPARDTAQVLASYVGAFDTTFIGLTGTPEAVDQVHRDFGGVHRVSPRKKDAHHYAVDHSSLLYLVGPDGRLTAQFAPPFDPPALARHVARMAQG